MKVMKKYYLARGRGNHAPTRTLAEAMVLANLTGRYLTQKSLNRKRAEYFAENTPLNPPFTGGKEVFSEGIPSAYDEAVAFFLAKEVVTSDEFKALVADMRKQAFSLAVTEKETIIKQVKESLDSAIEKGISLDDWKKDIQLLFDKQGITVANDYYLDTVFRNATQEAMNAGKDKIFGEMDTNEFPFLQHHTIMDGRQRKDHGKLNGFTAPVNDPIWNRMRYPLAHGCRCSKSAVHKDEGAQDSGWRPSLTGKDFEFVH
jgi:SPP1 gp7 family putative phage head morphogenesis protein